MEALTFYRNTQKRLMARVNGHTTLSAIYGDQAQPAHIEAGTQELPVWTTTQLKLQDPMTGNRYWNALIDPTSSTLPRRP